VSPSTASGRDARLTGDVAAMATPTRVERLRVDLADAGVDGLLVSNLANIRYLTGFTGSAAVLLVGPAAVTLTTDGRYRTQAAEQLTDSGVDRSVELIVGGVAVQRDALVERSAEPAMARLGLEANSVTWSAQRRWAEAFEGVEVVPTSGVVEALREVKDQGELARMARAAAIADAALGDVLPMLGEGATEHEVALALDGAMRRLGAEDRAFETIVASGPNAAKPHARPSYRVIEAGDPVVIDFGATYDGYRSDMTRTFSVGGAPEGELARVFDVVGAAQAAGVAAVVPGVSAGDVDRACRDLIAEAGWAAAFEHGTGHGVGLDIHESPSVGPASTAILRRGVVVTVEPGVYLAGLGGARVEDTVVVTSDGCRPLTLFPKDIAA
jgi:Xaa-Pro aminopeptidase